MLAIMMTNALASMPAKLSDTCLQAQAVPR
jgi:hypothetical protein